MSKRVQRRLAAIVIADVVGYSRMMGLDEPGTLAALTARRTQVIEPAVAAHDGRLVKLMGDGFFFEFGSAVDAVEAALEIQQQMAAANEGVPVDARLLLRIGINLGEVIVEGDDLFGDGVNVAARLECIAPPGGVVISGSAYEQVRNRIAAQVRDLGPQALKNIAEPVHAYEVSAEPSAGAADAPPSLQATTGAGRPSIAILPFANLGEDPAQGYFSDGITEDLITELSRWRLLSVRSRSASFRYRGMAFDTRQIARELDVRYIVEGSVRRLGKRLRISAQLIDTETGSHVWADKFDRDAADVFAVQDEVVRTIAGTLVGRLEMADAARARRKPPASLAAYECVLQGNALAWETPSGLAEASRLFERAVEIDPGYGFAHAMLAVIQSSRWRDDFGASDSILEGAYELAKRAVELDENESTCFSMLAHVCLLRRAFDQALQNAQRAVELNAGNQWNAADMGSVLVYLGRFDEALDWFRRAHETDPYLDPPWYWRNSALACLLLDRHDEALVRLGHVSIRQFRVSALMAACHAQLGHGDQARACVKECLALKPEVTVAAYMTREPFRSSDDAAKLAGSLLLAGLPA